jgi:hypothetical protein
VSFVVFYAQSRLISAQYVSQNCELRTCLLDKCSEGPLAVAASGSLPPKMTQLSLRSTQVIKECRSAQLSFFQLRLGLRERGVEASRALSDSSCNGLPPPLFDVRGFFAGVVAGAVAPVDLRFVGRPIAKT